MNAPSNLQLDLTAEQQLDIEDAIFNELDDMVGMGEMEAAISTLYGRSAEELLEDASLLKERCRVGAVKLRYSDQKT
jgi:hypothetical protein